MCVSSFFIISILPWKKAATLIIISVQARLMARAVPVNSDKPKNAFENNAILTAAIIAFSISSFLIFLGLIV
jgi:hypothetical protein